MKNKKHSVVTNTSSGNGFKTIHRKKIYEEIMAQIQEQLKKGLLKPGDRLPPERELTEIFKVSRHSIREAIRTLEHSRVLKSIPGSGTYITMGDKQSIVDLLATSLLKDTDKLSEIFQFRKIVEPQVVLMAAKNATDEDIRELEDLVKQQRKTCGKGKFNIDLFIRLDKEFHLTLSRAARNEVIIRVVERINDILSESREEVYQSKNRMKTSIRGHAEIIRAIKKRDEAEAIKSMFSHLDAIEKVVMRKHASKDKVGVIRIE